MSVQQAWDVEKWRRRYEDERMKRMLDGFEITRLKGELETVRRHVAPLDGEDVECGCCFTNLGSREYARDYVFCPYCGCLLDWEGAVA